MLKNKTIQLEIKGGNVRFYREKYNCEIGDIVEIQVSDLTKGCSSMIELTCDYCGKPYSVRYADYVNIQKRCIIKKDACNKCKNKKQNESVLEKYNGVAVVSLPEVREKINKTNLERYGKVNPMQNKDIQQKSKDTCLEKYGVDNPMKSQEIRESLSISINEIYGVDNVFANKDIQQKIKETNLKKYGVEHPMHNKDIAIKCHINSNTSKFENGTQSCSKQQKYIHGLFGGELNYLFDQLWLDIAYLDKNFYLEYNGSGHDIDVKYHKQTEKEFNIKEIKRYKFLKSKGWKQIVIISRKDIIPSDEVLLNIKQFAFNILDNTDSSWIKFDVDNKIIEYKNKLINYDYNSLIVI